MSEKEGEILNPRQKVILAKDLDEFTVDYYEPFEGEMEPEPAEVDPDLSEIEEPSMTLDEHHRMFRERLAKGEIMDFNELPASLDERENSNGLFARGWLRKGGAALLVSIAGSGKSVIAMQMMHGWAAGKKSFGIEPLRPLRIGYIQGEDDEQDLAEHAEGVAQGLKSLEKWTDEEIRAARQNLFFLSPQVARQGATFVEYIRNIQREHHFDLIVVNPLQSFAGCDIQANRGVTEFVRDGLDSVIKTPETACGLLIIHHTPKPPIDPRTKSTFGLDEYGEYTGAGASELTNWIRAMLTLMPVSKHRGFFYLTGVKRENRLGWEEFRRDEWVKPRLIIAHTPGYLYWRTFMSVPEGGNQEDVRPQEEIDAELMYKVLVEAHEEFRSTEFVKYAHKKLGKAITLRRAEKAKEYMRVHPEKFEGLEVVDQKSKNAVIFRMRDDGFLKIGAETGFRSDENAETESEGIDWR